jgi:tetratricopeptide (TPR) repeat protein
MATPKDSKDLKTKTPAAKPATAAAVAAPAAPIRVPPLFRRIDWLAFLVAFVVVGTVYLYTLAPEETLQDSGELCTGAFYAGIPHPPGYPFWSIYSWVWTKVLPIGNVAWRVEVGEAMAATFACALVALMVSRGSSMLMEGIEELKTLTGKWESTVCLVSGIVSGILLGLGGVMWSESVAINRISLFGVPWVMLVMLCLMRWIYAPHQRRYLFIAWFFLGICSTIHQTLLVAVLGMEIAVAYVQPKLGRNLIIWNVIGWLGLMLLEAVGISSMLNTSFMVLFIFHSVGVVSLIAFLWLSLGSKEDIMRPVRDAGIALLIAGIFVFQAIPALRGFFADVLSVACLGGAIWLVATTKDWGWEWAVSLGLGVLWVAGASFYFYEAIAGMTNPPMEWGYPRTVDGFFHALSRGQYEKANPTDIFHDPMRFIMQLGILIGDIALEFNWVCIFLALVPLMFFFKMRKRERSWIVGLMSVYFFISVLLIIMMNVQPDRQSADLFHVFYTSSHAIIGILIGYGLTLTVAYMATHYQRFRPAGLMLGAAALAPALIAFYSGVSDTFYGGVGLPSPVFRLLLFIFLAATLVLTLLAAQRLMRLSDAESPTLQLDRTLFLSFGGGAVLFALFSIGLVYFRPASIDSVEPSLALGKIFDGLRRTFAPHQYNYPALGGMLVLGIVVIFILALLAYRQRAPLAIMLGVFALMPISSALSHWGFCEQRNHWFGYWFGHDMFTPPVEGPDGKLTYDRKVREEMMKGPKKDLVYPEMTPNTILFGGTDPGRFNPTYMIFCDSFLSSNCLPAMDPAFDRRDVYLITQNALADPTYLDYLRAQYFRSQQKDPPFFSELARYVMKDKDYQTNALAKLVSPLDWYFESRGGRVEKRWRTFTSWFSDKDFTNLKSFTEKLRAKQDPVSQWLVQNFSSETQGLLSGNGEETRLREALKRDLNVLLERELNQQKELEGLQKKNDAVSQQIYSGDHSPSLQQKQDDLSKQIAGFKIDRLYDATRFAEVKISDYLREFIAQNPLADTRIRLNRLLLEAAYPDEIAKSLGGVYPDREIYIPNPRDSQQAFEEYTYDAQTRYTHDQQHPNEPRQLKPGEDVHPVDEQGHIQVSGEIAVMAINGLLTKVIFDHNPNNDFYVEESFPLDWMFPHLTPYGVIMKINRNPLPELTEDICKRDHEFWSKYSERLIGNWITYDTPVKDIMDWAEKVYLRHDYTDFKGDERFIRDDQAQKAFSKLRSSIAGIYSWRVGQPPSGGMMPREYVATGENFAMVEKEADFAFKQALAFCPYSPEAVYRYVQLLVNMRRLDDALLVAETARKLDPYNGQFTYLINNLNTMKSQMEAMPQIESDITRLENEVKANPTNFNLQFQLVQRLFDLRQNDRALQVLDVVLKNPQVPANVVLSVAQAYGQLGQPARMQAALEKLVQLEPDSPEAWYDLAASRAFMRQNPAAIDALKKALELNAKRLARDPKANDLRTNISSDGRFAALRDTPEFKTLPTH